MTGGSLKLTVAENITEQMLIENCLMYHHSGYSFMPLLCFYALAKGMKYDKLIYYINLIKGDLNV